MAEIVALQIDVDAGRSGQTLGKIEKDISGVNKEMNELVEINNEFKQDVIDLEARLKKIPKTMLSARKKVGDDLEFMKAQIKDNNLALQNFRLKKKQLKDMKRDIKSMSNEFVESSETVLGFGASLGEATAGFMLLTGASEESTEKLEQAIGVALAFEGTAKSISGAIKIWNEQLKNSAIIQKMVAAGTKVYAVAQGILNFVIGAGSKALKLFRLALISTGIGAIVVGIGMLIANFGKVKEVVMDVIMTAIEPFRKALQWIGLIESDEESARKKRASAEKQRAKERKAQIELEIEMLERLANIQKKRNDELISGLERWVEKNKALGKDTLQMEEQLAKDKIQLAEGEKEKMLEVHAKRKEILDEEIRLKEASVELWKTSNNKYGRIMLRDAEKDLLELKNSLDQSVSAVKEADEKVKQLEHDKEMARIERENKRKEDEKKQAEEGRKERKKRLETEKQALFDLEVARKEAEAEEILDEKKKAEALIEIERFKHEKELENKKLTDAEKELLEFEYQQRISDIAQEFANMELEKEQEERDRLAELREEKLEQDQELRDKGLEADKDLAEKKLELEKRVQDESFNLALGGIDALIQLNDAFQGQSEAQQKKAFERNKKLQIAQALISASQGVVNILANASTIPDPFGTIYKVGQLAILSAVTTAQIAKISQQQFSGSGGGATVPNISGGGGGGAPTLTPITNTSTLVPQEPQQVYVTETDITNTQNKVAVIEEQATIK